ncbi:unnamed protein product [Prorocentrum cordatum]|nr:unnamed protein product [Polarella glacialis]
MRRDPAGGDHLAYAPFPREVGGDGGPRQGESAMQPVKVQLGGHWPQPRAAHSTPGFSPDAGFVGGGVPAGAARQGRVSPRAFPRAPDLGRAAPSGSLQRAQQQMLPNSSVFEYSPSHTVVRVGEVVEIRPPFELAVSNAIFGISPQLPLGVCLDSHTGLILGKPHVQTDGPATYFVTACTSASRTGAPGRAPLDVSLHISQVHLEVVGPQAAQAAAPRPAGVAPGFAGRRAAGPSSRGQPAKVATGRPGTAHLDWDPGMSSAWAAEPAHCRGRGRCPAPRGPRMINSHLVDSTPFRPGGRSP